MDKQFRLDIISLSRTTFSGKVDSVTVPGADGELTILPHHIPLITPLRAGEIIVRLADESVTLAASSGFQVVDKAILVAISGGFLVIDPNHVTILADSAERLDELDEKKIQEAKERAEKLLTDKKFADDRSFADATAALEKSVAHLRMLKKHRSHGKGQPPSSN